MNTAMRASRCGVWLVNPDAWMTDEYTVYNLLLLTVVLHTMCC